MQTSTSAGSSNQEQQLRAQVELLKNHDGDSPAGSASADLRRTLSPYAQNPRSSDEYDQAVSPSRDAARAFSARNDGELHIHPDLRARPESSPDVMMPIAPHSGHTPEPSAGPSNPAIAPPPRQLSPSHGEEEDMKKYKRELSQTKRAAQNRAAQRAFRQRKETYIKKLEQQVRDYLEMEQSFKSLQTENYALREYILHLQARMVDAMGEFPQPPPNVNLSQSAHPLAPDVGGPPNSGAGQTGTGTPLEAVAQAVAGLAAQEQMAERPDQYPSLPRSEGGQEDTRTADEINKQLQPEERDGQ